MMKQHAIKLITLFTYSILSSSLAYAQEDPLPQIRKQFAAIEEAKNLKKTTITAEVPGGELDIAQHTTR